MVIAAGRRSPADRRFSQIDPLADAEKLIITNRPRRYGNGPRIVIDHNNHRSAPCSFDGMRRKLSSEMHRRAWPAAAATAPNEGGVISDAYYDPASS